MLELAVERVGVVDVEIEGIDNVEDLTGADRAHMLGDLEKMPDFLAVEQRFNIERHLSTLSRRTNRAPAGLSPYGSKHHF